MTWDSPRFHSHLVAREHDHHHPLTAWVDVYDCCLFAHHQPIECLFSKTILKIINLRITVVKWEVFFALSLKVVFSFPLSSSSLDHLDSFDSHLAISHHGCSLARL